MTGPQPDWQSRAAALARVIGETGVVRDEGWLTALALTPRHALVPRHHIQRGGRWEVVDASDPGWLVEVYRDTPLITALLSYGDGGQAIVSSSTKPGLMVRMLDALDIADGHRVLEIGTGTGYNAALLSHRLGADHVYSVDIGADLVDTARRRLAALGLHPVLEVADGLAGLPSHAPYDRIIATCSVPAAPGAWADQLRDGGSVLVDLKVGLHAGSLVLLHRRPDQLEGRFLPRWAGFMPARSDDGLPARPSSVEPTGHASERTTRVDPDPWAALVPWFLAHIGRPPVTGFRRQGPDLATTILSASDGSWCEVGPPDDRGVRRVRQGGPGALWDDIERAHEEWAVHGRPGWERLGLTVTRDGVHSLWLDRPDIVLRQFPTPM